MKKKDETYKFGNLGEFRIVKGNYPGRWHAIPKNLSIHSSGDTYKELEKNLINNLNEEKKKLFNRASEIEELAERIKEFGLKKTIQHYQNLQNKSEENK